MVKKLFTFFPQWFKYIGGLFMFLGAIGAYYFVYLGNKPEWLQMKVFTFYSKYLRTTRFDYIINNQGDELVNILYVLGFVIIVLSGNNSKNNTQVKLEALSFSFIISLFVFMLLYLFIHGMALFYLSIGTIYAMPLLFLILYVVISSHKTVKKK